MPSILIVDDQESIHEMLDSVVQPMGFETSFASNGSEALEKFKQQPSDIVLTDIRMEAMDGIQLLAEVRKINPKAIVIMMSGYADTKNAMASLKQGAFDYLTKPFKVDQLISAIKRAILKIREQAAEKKETNEDPSQALIGDSAAIGKLRQTIAKLATTKTPILLQGEAGTQKALIASLIHESDSSEEESPFISVDCKSISPEGLRIQLIQGQSIDQAKGGTLFIRDVDELPIDLQGELGNKIREVKTEVRIICSSGLDLEAKVNQGAFDDSLFYRISTIPVHIPSLRERSQDVPLLAISILQKSGIEDLEFNGRAKALLQGYRWPGNYTELKEVVEAAAGQAEDGQIGGDDLPEKVKNIEAWPTLSEHLQESTHEYMIRVLQACQGDVERAAKILECEKEKLADLT
ncbi:MAG: sigma-54 dependent transcriptional regulator [Verrucomicrobiota bacterium]